MIPGGRVLGAVGKAAKNAERAMDSADDVGDAAKAARNATQGPPSPGGCKHSFDPRTPVLMADGSVKAIGSVKVGDVVLAADPEAARNAARPVTVVHRNQDRDLSHLTVTVDPTPGRSGDETVELIKTTWHHPFWVQTRDQWVDAARLRPGDQLRALGAAEVTVLRVDNFVGARWMSDLTVADLHTYYIVVDREPVLVHNTGPLPVGPACLIGGHSPAAATGQAVHNDPALTAAMDAIGFRRGPTTGAQRPDFLARHNDPIELKPNSPSGLSQGRTQLSGYLRGGSFGRQGELWAYTVRPSGLWVLQRAAVPRIITPPGRLLCSWARGARAMYGGVRRGAVATRPGDGRGAVGGRTLGRGRRRHRDGSHRRRPSPASDH
jgi:hypothetical protein